MSVDGGRIRRRVPTFLTRSGAISATDPPFSAVSSRPEEPMLDYWLAVAHHLIVFALVVVVALEISLLKPPLDTARIARVARIDMVYGALALAIILVGFARAGMAAKGWYYYSHNLFFWLKVGTFALIGILSAPATVKFMRWRRASKADPAWVPPADELRRVRLLLHVEATLFIPLIAFAAAMARGYGLFG
jgi:putative membrane protein